MNASVYTFRPSDAKKRAFLSLVLLLCALLCGCAADPSEQDSRNAVCELECLHPAAVSGMCPIGEANAAVCSPDAEGNTVVQLIDTDDDSVVRCAELSGEWSIRQHSFCDGRIVLCDREHNRWRFFDRNLTELGTVDTENSDGFFSYDAKSYYFLRDDVLWRQELESGKISRVEFEYDLRFLELVAFDGPGSRMTAQFYLSPYSSKCGTAIFDPTTGKFSMLQSERYRAVFADSDVLLMLFDENAMGYSVLNVGGDGKAVFADAGIFRENSSELYGIERSRYLMGTGAGISTLYCVGQQVSACALSDYGIYGEIYNICPIGDGERLLGGVYSGGKFSLYVIDTNELDFKRVAETSAASPLSVNEELAQSYIDESSGSAVAETLSQARSRADELCKKYSVQILLSSQCRGAAAQCDYEITLTDAMDPDEELGSINAALKSLERCFALYPEGFFAQFRNSAGEGGVRFLLVEEIKSSFGVSGCEYERGQWQNIALDIRMAYRIDGIVCHEIWHATEKHILSSDYSLFTVDDWAKLNPADFSYYRDYDAADSDERWTYYSGGSEGVYFVDDYSKTFEGEDRARIMEFFMTRDDDARELIKSPAMKAKLRHMCRAIRAVFDTDGWENVRWERLL